MRTALKYTAKRLAFIPISVFLLVTLTQWLATLIPGNPAVVILGQAATPARIAMVDRQLGVNKPFWSRFLDYWRHLLHGNLGQSFFTGRPVTQDLIKYVPSTVELILLSLALALILGLLIGTVGGYFANRLPDRLTRVLTSGLQAIPDFFLGVLLIYLLFFLLGIAPPPTGQTSIAATKDQPITGLLLVDSLLRGNFDTFTDAVRHAFIPVVTLGIAYAAYFAKTTRSVMGKTLFDPQVEFARACGLPEWRVLHYAFISGRSPILTYAAMLFGDLLGGAAIVETIFDWRGLGQWGLRGVLRLDVPVMQGFVLAAGLLTLVVFLILDVLILTLDPRVTYG
jgi:peptide/nickel transport system permease protein